MTTLTLTDAAIAPISDLTDVLLIGQYSEAHDTSTETGVRRYAGGRDRVVSSPGESVSVQVAFRYISRANYLALVDLVGVPVLFRDQRGRRTWGVVSNLSATEFSVRDLLEGVSFTLTSITHTEVV